MNDMLAQFIADNPGMPIPASCVSCGDHDSVGCTFCAWPWEPPEPPRTWTKGVPSPLFW